jgi:hypothetical protein
VLVGTSLCAAPLAWFPGPALGTPRSGAATTVFSGGNNLLIGGDSYGSQETLVQELAATNNFWTHPQSYLFPYSTLAPGAVNGGGMVIYYGGNDGIGSTSAAISYSPSDGATVLASMSVARSYLGYAADRSGNAYAIGGLDDNGAPLSSAEFYSQDNAHWAAIARLPTALYSFPAAFDGTNYIYTFGGFTNKAPGMETATLLRYSVSANNWTARAPMPVAVAGSAAALGADGKIYVVGGTSGGVTTNVVQVYNPAANSWAISTPLPEGLSLAAMGADSLGRLIVMGGMDTNGDDVSDVWRSQRLNVPDSAPVLTQLPSTSATYLAAYTSSITATGSPPPTYSLVSGPAGIQVDYYSGAITWTPQGLGQIGTNQVTIRAANYAGATNWNFSITVPNPPPTRVSNLTVVSVTEYSVMLGWNPESLAVGPTTFTVAIGHPWHDPKGSGGGINYQVVGSTTSTNFTIYNLEASTSYIFGVAPTAPGGTNGYADIGATTLAAPTPTNLRITGLTSTTISLAWDAPVGPIPVVSYKVLGWFNGVAVQYPLAYPNIYATAVTLTGLTPGAALLWGVSAYDTYGNLSGYNYLPSLVINPVPAPAALTAVAMPPAAGGFNFTVQASAVQTILIQATTNPGVSSSWVTIATNPPSGTTFNFTDTNASQFPKRFYRVVTP